MTIRILCLYNDLLNLYGEVGLINIIKYHLEGQGFKVGVDEISINNHIDFSKYSFIHIGMGSEDNQRIVLDDFMKYKKEVKKYIENDGVLLATGNSMELFGKTVDGSTALGIFGYNAHRVAKRCVDEVIFKCDFLDKEIIGFQNQISFIDDIESPMFPVVKGLGSDNKSRSEGFNYKNFFGTYVVGPIVARNPHFSEYIIRKIILNTYPDFKFKKFNFKSDWEAYNNYINWKYKDILGLKDEI